MGTYLSRDDVRTKLAEMLTAGYEIEKHKHELCVQEKTQPDRCNILFIFWREPEGFVQIDYAGTNKCRDSIRVSGALIDWDDVERWLGG